LFTISNNSDNQLLSRDILDKVHHPKNMEFEVTYRVIPDKEKLKESIECSEDHTNKLLIIQKGARNFSDKMFRNYFTNEFVYEGKFPMIILPHNEVTIVD